VVMPSSASRSSAGRALALGGSRNTSALAEDAGDHRSDHEQEQSGERT